MKRLAMLALLASLTISASAKQAPIVHGPVVAAKASWRVLSWPFRAPKAKPAKKADGSGPIQTCRPGTNCDPVA